MQRIDIEYALAKVWQDRTRDKVVDTPEGHVRALTDAIMPAFCSERLPDANDGYCPCVCAGVHEFHICAHGDRWRNEKK